MPSLRLVTPQGRTLELDTDNPTAAAQAVQGYVQERETAVRQEGETALAAANADADVLRGLVADDLVARRALSAGEGFDAAAHRAHLLTLTPAQLEFERAQALAAGRSVPPQATSTEGPPAPPAPEGDQPKPNPFLPKPPAAG